MADLTVTIGESVTINGAARGSSNTITTTGIVDTYERVLTAAHSQTTTIAVFGSTPHSAAGALDVENAKYVRITNLSSDQDMKLAIVTTNTNYQVTVRAGGSHVLFQAENAAIGETDTSPAFGTLEDVTSVQVRPSATTDIQVEMFAALV
tara:strand:+ start:156 stop:605 length:450 start_codon:yes stop_codon:yes gene_type:complete